MPLFMRHWYHYFIHNDFVLYSNHEALKHIKSRGKLSDRHAKWAAYIQQFSFVLKHKFGALNRVADVMSRRASFLTFMCTKVLSFDSFRGMLSVDPFFSVCLMT